MFDSILINYKFNHAWNYLKITDFFIIFALIRDRPLVQDLNNEKLRFHIISLLIIVICRNETKHYDV